MMQAHVVRFLSSTFRFQNRRIVLLLAFSVVLIRVFYILIKLQIKKQQFSLKSLLLLPSSLQLDKNQTNIQILNITFTEVSRAIKTTSNLNANTKTTMMIKTFVTQLLFYGTGSYSNSSKFSIPDPISYPLLPNCSFNISNDTSSYKINITDTIKTYNVIENDHGSDLHLGGHWFPKNCQAEERIAIIVPYRKREEHLKIFLDNIHPFLKRQQLDYTIIVVNQHGKEPFTFNRGALLNVGYIEAIKLYPFTCFIFHDVDLIPEDARNIYKCVNQPRHMRLSVTQDNVVYPIPYPQFFGGVAAFRPSDFVGANGSPNVYWGWGGEDDDMYARVVKHLKKQIIRFPIIIGGYKMLRGRDHISGPVNPHRFQLLDSKYNYSLDGLNTANYILHHVIFYKLFTLINVTLPEETFDQIRIRLRIKDNYYKG